MNVAATSRFRRRHLPHWEVEGGRYFVTVRCADSLPREAVTRLAAIAQTLARIEPHSSQFLALQRAAFRTLEKYLDAGSGTCPLRCKVAAEVVRDEFEALAEWQVAVPHFTVMPNHWHAIIVPAADGVRSLTQIMKRLKGRTGKRLREMMGGGGPVWQGEWFDRWIRNEAEFERVVAYIRANPVQAGLVARWQDHPWTR